MLFEFWQIKHGEGIIDEKKIRNMNMYFNLSYFLHTGAKIFRSHSMKQLLVYHSEK